MTRATMILLAVSACATDAPAVGPAPPGPELVHLSLFEAREDACLVNNCPDGGAWLKLRGYIDAEHTELSFVAKDLTLLTQYHPNPVEAQSLAPRFSNVFVQKPSPFHHTLILTLGPGASAGDLAAIASAASELGKDIGYELPPKPLVLSLAAMDEDAPADCRASRPNRWSLLTRCGDEVQVMLGKVYAEVLYEELRVRPAARVRVSRGCGLGNANELLLLARASEAHGVPLIWASTETCPADDLPDALGG